LPKIYDWIKTLFKWYSLTQPAFPPILKHISSPTYEQELLAVILDLIPEFIWWDYALAVSAKMITVIAGVHPS